MMRQRCDVSSRTVPQTRSQGGLHAVNKGHTESARHRRACHSGDEGLVEDLEIPRVEQFAHDCNGLFEFDLRVVQGSRSEP